jgi:nicotinate-nucleotide adenylyltransferase
VGTPNEKIAVLGGSFNPPHVAHVLAATWVLSTCDVDHVLFMPCAQHAFGKTLLPFADRLALTRLAVEPIRRVSLTDIEARLAPPNYTVDTLAALQEERPAAQFSLIVGADVLHDRRKWKSWDVLEQNYGFHILGRSGYQVPAGYGASVELPQISSTHLRGQLAEGDLDGCVGHMDLDVLDEVARGRLYDVPEASAASWLHARVLV